MVNRGSGSTHRGLRTEVHFGVSNFSIVTLAGEARRGQSHLVAGVVHRIASNDDEVEVIND